MRADQGEAVSGLGAGIAPDAPGMPPTKKRNKRAIRPQLLNRTQLDGRTNAARHFDRLVADIHADLGGQDQLSAIELALVEAFAGAAVTMDNLNTRILLGEQIDLAQHAQAVSAMVRVASRLGLRRRARDVSSPGLTEYLDGMSARDTRVLADEGVEP